MLLVKSSRNIVEELKTVGIGNDIDIYTRNMKSNGEGKTALCIHGRGSCSNHTMLVRPGKLLMEKELFSKVILPDRRGREKAVPLPKS